MSLSSTLLADEARPALNTDLVTLVDDEVSQLSGLSGVALKGAFATAKKVQPNIVSGGIRRMLPDLLKALDSHWDSYSDSATTDFGAYLHDHANTVVPDLMAITDRYAQNNDSPKLTKMYQSMRSKGEKTLAGSIGPLGRVLEKHMLKHSN